MEIMYIYGSRILTYMMDARVNYQMGSRLTYLWHLKIDEYGEYTKEDR